jgi:hypothetical protein
MKTRKPKGAGRKLQSLPFLIPKLSYLGTFPALGIAGALQISGCHLRFGQG